MSITRVSGLHIGVDVGGTFTDAAAVMPDGTMTRAKSLTTPGAQVDGIVNALTALAETRSESLKEMLAGAEHLSVGTTVVTNAIAQMKGRKTALFVTKGFRDTLAIARTPRVASVDPFVQAAMPKIVTRDCIVEVDERIDLTGSVLASIKPHDIANEAARLATEEGVEAFAVCLLWAFLNPTNEAAVREAIESAVPGAFVTTSSELHPVIGEYERMVTTCLNAFVSEAVASYVDELDRRLTSEGFEGRVYLGQSLGGVLDGEEAARRPLHLFNSGPVGGVIGAKRLADAMGIADFLTADLGGTSFDVALVRGGQPDVTHRTKLGRFETGVSQVDITTVGAGGGSICWLDERGAPRVGPHSAGSRPGPVCYGRGGTEPTITDMAAVLGLLDPDFFLGGTMPLDVEAARLAVQDSLGSLGETAEDIASQMSTVIINTMIQAVRKVSVQRGRDPRGLVFFAFGGATALFAADICRGAGMRRIVIPDYAAVFSALGLVSGDPIRTEAQSVAWDPAGGSLEEVNDAYGTLAEHARTNMLSRGFAAEDISVEYLADMRYSGQSFDVQVPLPAWPMTEADRSALISDFQERYVVLYGPGSAWEEFPTVLMTARVVARGFLPRPPLATTAVTAEAAPQPTAKRRIYLGAAQGWADVDVYTAHDLLTGHTLAGPCVVEKHDTTVLVPADFTLRRDEYQNIELQLTISEET